MMMIKIGQSEPLFSHIEYTPQTSSFQKNTDGTNRRTQSQPRARVFVIRTFCTLANTRRALYRNSLSSVAWAWNLFCV